MSNRIARSPVLAAKPDRRAQYLARRVRKPIVLDHLKTYRATIPPARFKQLNIDETYQRVRIADWVNDLIHTIRAGGMIPDPIALAERPDGTLWIVDGQQRFWAASECGVALEATIYKVPDPRTEDYATERKLFYVLNRARGLNSQKKVGAWSGHLTVLLRRVDESGAFAQHKISYDYPGHAVYSPPALARGVVALLSPTASPAFLDLDSVLRTSETLLASKDAQARAQSFLLLVPRAFPNPKDAKLLAVIALARVAARRWATRITDVDKATLARLARMNTATLAPTYASRFLPVVEAAIEQRWRA